MTQGKKTLGVRRQRKGPGDKKITRNYKADAREGNAAHRENSRDLETVPFEYSAKY